MRHGNALTSGSTACLTLATLLLSASSAQAGSVDQEYVVGWDFAHHVVLVADYSGLSHEDLPPMRAPTNWSVRTPERKDIATAFCDFDARSRSFLFQPDSRRHVPPPPIVVPSCEVDVVARAWPGYTFETAGAVRQGPEPLRIVHKSGPKETRTDAKGVWAIEVQVGGRFMEVGRVNEYGPPQVSRVVVMGQERLVILRRDIAKDTPGFGNLSKRWEVPVFFVAQVQKAP